MSFSFGNAAGSLGSTEKKTGTLFGSTTAPAGGLFGQSQQQQQSTGTTQPSLFGSAAPAASNSLFGGAQQQNTGASLFGQPQQNAGSSLFGQPQQQQQQQQPQQNAGQSLFGQPQQQQQQAPQQQTFNNSLFGSSLQPAPALNASQAQTIQQQRDGLPQLRQSSAQPLAASSVSGHRAFSTYFHIDKVS